MFDRSRCPSSVSPNQRSSAPLRSVSSCHGTMLEWCSISVITTRSPALTSSGPAQAIVLATRFSASEAFLVNTTSSREGALRKRGDLVAGLLEGGRRLGAELVHRPRHVGVVALQVVDHRVDHHLRLLRGVGAVEVDQRVGHRSADVPGSGSPCGSPRARAAARAVDGPQPSFRVTGFRDGRRATSSTSRLLSPWCTCRSPRPRAGRRARGHPPRRPGRRRRRARSRG